MFSYEYIDKKTNALITIRQAHHAIHDEQSFTTQFSNDVTNIGEMTVIALNAPAGPELIHMLVIASATAGASFLIVENPSIDVGEGTEKTPFNRFRPSIKTSTVTSIEAVPSADEVTTYNEVQANGANITTTTQIWHEDIGRTGSPVSSSAGGSRGQFEFVLKPETQYAFILIADDANDNTHNLILDWYEQIPT